MPRYIDADELLNKLNSDDSLKHARRLIKSVVLEQPTAEVQPVVHCKNCKYCVDNQACKRAYQGRFYTDVRPNDYCSYGEKSERIETDE